MLREWLGDAIINIVVALHRWVGGTHTYGVVAWLSRSESLTAPITALYLHFLLHVPPISLRDPLSQGSLAFSQRAPSRYVNVDHARVTTSTVIRPLMDPMDRRTTIDGLAK